MGKKLLPFLALFAFSCAAATRYVAPTNGGGSDAAGNDGTNRNTPLATITNAIALSATDDTVVLLTGTHKLDYSITVDKRLTMCGEGAKEDVIIDGQKGARTLTVSAAGALLHSFSVIQMLGTSVAIQAIVMSGNSTLSNLVVRNNGVGVTVNNTRYPIRVTSGKITNCWITNNYSLAISAAYVGNATLENCYIAGNTATKGSRYFAGILYVDNANAVVRNCTIVNNVFNNAGGYGALCMFQKAKIQNNIIYGHVDDKSGSVCNWSCGSANMANCYGNCTTPLLGTTANGNTDENPLLQDDAMHFYRSSPCYQKAVVATGVSATAYDLDGNPRGEHPSIGAFEYVDAGTFTCLVEASAPSAIQPSTVTLSVQLDGSYTEPLSYAWDFNGDGVVDSTVASPALSAVGVYTPSVTVTDAASKSASASYGDRIVIYDEGGNVYVTSKENPASSPPYSTWATAATNIYDAMDYALSGKTIYLDAGRHSLTSRVDVYKAVTIASTNATEVTTFRRRNGGNYQYFHLENTSSVLKDITVANSTFGNNSGAIVSIGNGKLRGCKFIGNTISGAGAVSIGGANGAIERCVFIGNSTSTTNGYGPAAIKLNAGGTVRDCLFVCNTNKATGIEGQANHYQGGVAECCGSNSKIYNSTFVGNVSWVDLPGGIYNPNKGEVRNCISYGNLAHDGSTTPASYTNANGIGVAQGTTRDKTSNCCVSPQTEDYTGYEGMVFKDPLFKNAAAGDFSLSSASPCINAGTNLHFNAGFTDLAGNPRIYKFGKKSGIIDIGCYEAVFDNAFFLFVQ
jgi:hypothetical protein